MYRRGGRRVAKTVNFQKTQAETSPSEADAPQTIQSKFNFKIPASKAKVEPEEENKAAETQKTKSKETIKVEIRSTQKHKKSKSSVANSEIGDTELLEGLGQVDTEKNIDSLISGLLTEQEGTKMEEEVFTEF